MYFESKTHALVELNNAQEAAAKIKTDFAGHHAARWPSADGKYMMYAVPDGHVDNPKIELALLRGPKENHSTEELQQVESITNGWIESPEELGRYLVEAESSEIIMQQKVHLIIDKPKGNETAWFDCGCCGTGFKSNVKYQLQFGQDSGYGICPGCERYYK